MNDMDQRKKMLAGIFDRASATYDREGVPLFAHFARALVEHAGISTGDHVLDVATGTGRVLVEAAARVGTGGSVIGVDISEGMLQRAREDIEEAKAASAMVVLVDGEALPFAAGSFDALLCGFGLFFMPDPDGALDGYRRVLRAEGTIAFSTWASDTGGTQFAWLQDLMKRFAPPGVPTRPPFTKFFEERSEIETTLAEAGFGQVAIECEELDLVFPDAEAWWAWSRSHGNRGPLERMDADTLEAYKAAAFELVAENAAAADGVHLPMRALITTARAAP